MKLLLLTISFLFISGDTHAQSGTAWDTLTMVTSRQAYNPELGFVNVDIELSPEVESMDGRIIEAIQHSTYPHVQGIQFHPEKPGLFDPSIKHQESCGSTINFQEAIKTNDSYAFHVAFWNYIAKLLQTLRETK